MAAAMAAAVAAAMAAACRDSASSTQDGRDAQSLECRSLLVATGGTAPRLLLYRPRHPSSAVPSLFTLSLANEVTDGLAGCR